MSQATEIAEREAAAAEAEQPEPEPDTEPAPEPQPQPEPESAAPTEAQIEAIWKTLGREAERHAREVEKRSGPMWSDLHPCPLCTMDGATPGFIFPSLPEPTQTARREYVAAQLGGGAAPDYKTDPERETCETCEGLGMLRTGSRVPNQDALPCRACNGQGWRQKLQPPPVYTPPTTAPTVGAPPPNGAAGGPIADPWGRPLGHPHYGRSPADVTG